MTTRKSYFDLMRIVAIFFVIFNHTGNRGFALYTVNEPGSAKYWLYLCLSIFCTYAVPLFFMISGALVLPKATLEDVWKRRIPKMALILVLFSLFYHLLGMAQGEIGLYTTFPTGELPSVATFLTVLYAGDWNFSFWFLYAYLAFLMFAPLLRTLAEHMTNRQFYYLFILDLVFKAGVPVLNWTVFRGAFDLNANLLVTWAVADIVIYPLAGYFLEHRFDMRMLREKKWLLPALWGTVLLCLALAAAMTWHKSILTGEYNEGAAQTFHRVFHLIIAGTVYLTTKQINPKTNAVLTSAGVCTFGIYLLHVAVLKSPQADALYGALTGMGWWHIAATLVVVLVTLAVCWAATALWKGAVKLVKRQ